MKGLPHLYGKKWYRWARAFFESFNRMNLLCAANQCTKSSTQIRKCIDWATGVKKWPKLWKHTPRVFWYLYPSLEVATIEFEKKWIPEFMPANEYKEHPQYGWKAEYDKKMIKAIHFHSGISVYFKVYTQDASNLQTGTVDAIFCFPKGTGITTKKGATPIEEIKVGDLVLTHTGKYQRVTKVFEPRLSKVIARKFSNGEVIRATENHPFWVNNAGYKTFSELTPEDQCGTLLSWKQTKNLPYLKASFTRATQSIKTFASAPIVAAVARGVSYTWLFGKLVTDLFLKVMLFTIKTIIPYSITQRILNASLVRSTLVYIKRLSGASAVTGISSVKDVARILHLEALREQLHATARKIAGVLESIVSAYFAKLNSNAAGKLHSVFVASDALTAEDTLVYNFEVENDHTYFAEGFLVHNCDEELPEELLPELQARLFSTKGYFHMVFTATLNQEIWYRAIEGTGKEELYNDAFKLQVSMYECLTYEDGSPGQYTIEDIKYNEAMCKSEAEKQRRIYGKFISDAGRKYYTFNPARHYIAPFQIPSDWVKLGCADGGSGGKNHPGAISFMAVRPDFRYAVVYKCWRGDFAETTDGDIYKKFCELRGSELLNYQIYDAAAKDFGTIAMRAGDSFLKAEKSHELGESLVNTLFQHDMLHIFDGTDEARKMGVELTLLLKSTPKQKAKDDLADTLRYNVCQIPWDFTHIKLKQESESLEAQRPPTKEEIIAAEIRWRRGENDSTNEKDAYQDIQEEVSFWNEQYGN